MSGFDNGTLQNGISSRTKRFGAILRGLGPPAPQSGVAGDVYLDTQTWYLYAKREEEATDPWGSFLFQVPEAMRSGLKWFNAFQPTNDIGVDGDYCLLWGGYNNYGTQPSVYGPKATGCWPESGDGPDVLLDPSYAGYTLPAGLTDEGTLIAFSASTQLVAAGALDEFILAIPVPQIANSTVTEIGLQSTPGNVAVNLNPTYTAIDQHAV